MIRSTEPDFLPGTLEMDVFARNARDIRARSADEFLLDDGDTLSFAGKRPRSERRSRSVPEDNKIVLFRLRLLEYLSG